MKITTEKYWDLKNKDDELMSQRLGWLLTSQIVLFAAYGILIKDVPLGSNKRLIYVIEGFGITIACLILIGILAAILASYILYRKVNNKIDNPLSQKPAVVVHPVLTVIAWLDAAFIPVIFIIAWIMVM